MNTNFKGLWEQAQALRCALEAEIESVRATIPTKEDGEDVWQYFMRINDKPATKEFFALMDAKENAERAEGLLRRHVSTSPIIKVTEVRGEELKSEPAENPAEEPKEGAEKAENEKYVLRAGDRCVEFSSISKCMERYGDDYLRRNNDDLNSLEEIGADPDWFWEKFHEHKTVRGEYEYIPEWYYRELIKGFLEPHDDIPDGEGEELYSFYSDVKVSYF